MIKRILSLLPLVLLSLLVCCSSEPESRFDFSFRSDQPADAIREATLYARDESVRIEAALAFEGESVAVIISEMNGQEIVSETLRESGDYTIRLVNILSDTELKLTVRINRCRSMSLTLFSFNDLDPPE